MLQVGVLRTRCICSIHNEAVLKAIFKLKDVELNVIEIAIEIGEADNVAKDWYVRF